MSIRLKAHGKPLGRYSEIDKYVLIPKKLWEDFKPGEKDLVIKGIKTKTRVYDVLCDCVKPDHNHRLIDLRDYWEQLGINDGDSLEIEND